MTVSPIPWWKSSTIYQIYPASFKDSNGDGVGDIPGIISELDYIKNLGVDVIWLCPMYDSPQIDMGYDISDYEAIYPPYGTMQDMDDLINGCHERGMRIIVDLVINHTSHLHPWFKESRSSKDNPKRDWYIWRPAKYDSSGNRKPPNNWRSNFSGPAWEWDDVTQEYYLHLFCPEQPDLNWENPETRRAIYDSAIEFWLQKGVDGFRIDTVNMYSKPPSLPDAPIIDVGAEAQYAADLFCNGPRMHEYLREINEILTKYDAMSVGETPNTRDREKVLKYVSAKEKGLNMVFQFDVVDLGQGVNNKYDTVPFNWSLPDLKRAIESTQDILSGTDAWTTVFMENHDQSRSITRFGNDRTPELRDRSGKLLALMQATLSGTLYIYQGQEIGMTNAPASWPMAEYKDVEGNNYYNMVSRRTGGDPAALERAKKAIQHLARDHSRLPMHWDDSLNAGFSKSGKPWMRVNDNYKEINVSRQSGDKGSLLAFWRKMLKLRKDWEDVFVHGAFDMFELENENTFVFAKTAKGKDETALVMLNFGDEERKAMIPKALEGKKWRLIVGNFENAANQVEQDVLKGWEGRVYITA